jgi:hypothetical protein
MALGARFGDLLHKITTPLVMGLLCFRRADAGCRDPAPHAARIPLRLKRDGKAASYWIERRPPGPAPDSLHQAF